MGIVLVLSLFLFLLRSAQKREYGFLNDYLILYIKKENYFKFNTKSIIIFFLNNHKLFLGFRELKFHLNK